MSTDKIAQNLAISDKIRAQKLLIAAKRVTRVSIMVSSRLAVLESQVVSLMTFQKWQMGILAAILLLILKSWIK